MQAEIETREGCRRVMHISADWAEIEDDYKGLVKEFNSSGIPGFRPGKAPSSIVEKRCASQIEDVLKERAVRRLLHNAAHENDLGPVGLAEARDVEFAKGGTLSFTAEFDVAPDIELPDYAAFDPGSDLSDAEAKDALSEFLLSSTSFEVPRSLVDEELRGAEDVVGGPEGADDAQREAAEGRVRLLLILRKISEAEGIEVDDRDVDERITAMAKNYGTRPQALRTELEQKNGLRRLKLFLLAEGTMDYILGCE